MDVGTSEGRAFWLALLKSLTAPGLGGVELVISNAHQGLQDAIATVFAGAAWRRYRTHFMTNLLTRVPKRAPSTCRSRLSRPMPIGADCGAARNTLNKSI